MLDTPKWFSDCELVNSIVSINMSRDCYSGEKKKKKKTKKKKKMKKKPKKQQQTNKTFKWIEEINK